MTWGWTGEQARAAMEPDFLALPLSAVADVAIAAGQAAGAEHVDVRVARQRGRHVATRDASSESVSSQVTSGIGVRVLVAGVWGFAAGDAVTTEQAARLAREAVELAQVSAGLATVRVVLAPEPVQRGQAWASEFVRDPFAVSDAEIVELLRARSAALLGHAAVQHVDGLAAASRDLTFYADSAGTSSLNQRTRIQSELTAVHVGEHGFEDLTTMAPPTARGWEYVSGDAGFDWGAAVAALGDNLAEKVAAPSVEPGRYDLLIDPSNLWLTIHESVGHATELDRALGYEANYAGTSFATFDQLGTLRYGSPLMNVTGDRLAPHGLATTGFDDEGVSAQSWDLIRGGTLVGYQLDRRMAQEKGFGRSNGCAFADSAHRVPIQRMPNVSLVADPAGPDLATMISGVDDGLLIYGDKSWSIDMARYNFQFTGQLFYRIRNGQLAGQVKDVAYQARTPDFWGALDRVGGPPTYLLGGAVNCGKGQPGQTAAVSHGAPACLFRGINVLNTTQEAAQ
ncbi:MAG: TldD/PmbA family protein [Candidatus Nanopelagicales bacterium]